MAIADHLTPDGYVACTENGTKYQDLKEAYDAYTKLVTTGAYQDYKDTLPKKLNQDRFGKPSDLMAHKLIRLL